MSIKDKVENFGKVGENMAIFRKTMKAIDSSDMLKESVNKSIEDGFIFTPDDWADIPKEPKYETIVDVNQNGSFEAAMLIRAKEPDEKIAVLNFASAKNPGGMVTKGSSAQEESLCRVSTLYKVISDKKFKPYYDKYNQMKDFGKFAKYMYTDTAIYSPNIKVVLDLMTKEVLLEDNMWNVDVITSAFPNLRHLKENEIEKDLDEIYDRRIENVFQLAYKEGVETLILGAWGCGVFQNDPTQVAEAFLKVQKRRYDGLFKRIIHPVFCNKGEEKNYTSFRKVFGFDEVVEETEEGVENE